MKPCPKTLGIFGWPTAHQNAEAMGKESWCHMNDRNLVTTFAGITTTETPERT